MYADLALRQGQLDEAYDHAVKAANFAKASGSMTPWVSSALYYMGHIRLCQKKSGEAM